MSDVILLSDKMSSAQRLHRFFGGKPFQYGCYGVVFHTGDAVPRFRRHSDGKWYYRGERATDIQRLDLDGLPKHTYLYRRLKDVSNIEQGLKRVTPCAQDDVFVFVYDDESVLAAATYLDKCDLDYCFVSGARLLDMQDSDIKWAFMHPVLFQELYDDTMDRLRVSGFPAGNPIRKDIKLLMMETGWSYDVMGAYFGISGEELKDLVHGECPVGCHKDMVYTMMEHRLLKDGVL